MVVLGLLNLCDLDYWCWKIDLSFIETKKNGCPALQLENREHKVVFTGGAVLNSVFEREFKGIFSVIRAEIMAQMKYKYQDISCNKICVVWWGGEEEIRAEHCYLDIFFFCFNGNKTMNNEIIVFFNLIPELLELCNETPS